MDLAGDVIQALATFLNVDDLQSTADFPHEMEKLREILVKVIYYISLTVLLNTIFLQLKDTAFSLQNSPKNLDLSCKIDVEFWGCFEREKTLYRRNIQD